MRVFIGCSAYDSIALKYKDLACSVSEVLAKRGDKLVFGGSDTGMMYKCYQTFRYHNSKIKAINDIKWIDILKEMEYDREEITPTTFERCKNLYLSSELIVILPGGIGTLSELMGMVEEKRTRGDNIDIIVFNLDGFYDDYFSLMKKLREEGFVHEDEDIMKLVKVVKTMDEFIKVIERRN